MVGSGRGAKLHDRVDRSEQLEDHEAERRDEEPQGAKCDQDDGQPAWHEGLSPVRS